MIDIGTYSLVDWAWRATLVLAAAGLVNFLFRGASASVRHLVWACALAGVLAVPLVSRALPRWTVPLRAGLLEAPEAALLRVQARVADIRTVQPAATQSSAPSAPARGSRFLPVALLWMAGAAAVLLHAALGWFFVMRLRRAAAPARPGTCAMALELATDMGIGQTVRVLETGRAAIPVTWGVFRPVIVVPAAVADDAAQLRVVLIHELAHIARRDYLVHLVGQIACAFYWFHPLAWVAQRQALRLRERAADDLVLRHGVRASEYAGHLVGLARTLAAPRLCGSLAMAHRSYLEQRVRAILDGRARRVGLSRAAVVAATAFAAAFVMGIASVGAVAAGQVEKAAPIAAAAPEERNLQLTRAAEDAKARFGVQSVEYARTMASLGDFYYRSDRLPEALAAYGTAMPVLEQRLGKSSAELVQPLYVQGLVAHVNKDLTLAAQHYQRAVDIASANGLGTGPAILARVALAQIASKDGDDTRAAALLQQARVASQGESAEMAVVLETSSYILRKLGSEADADKAEGEAKAMRLRLGSGRPSPDSVPAQGVVGGILRNGFQDRPTGRPEEVFRIGNGVKPPRLLAKVEPEYSQEARALKVQGATVLQTIVGADGVAHDTRVVRGVGLGLDQKAIEAVRQWRFEPGTKDGAPVNVSATIEVNFRLM